MAFIGNKTLEILLKSSGAIDGFNPDKIKNGAYEMSLGSQVFQTDSSPRSVKDLKQDEKIEIKPGQFALLLTQEYVKIPKDKIAFISIKASIKFKGLINVSGFHVDPGFEGNLLFSVYNAGPSNIILSRGQSYFPIWFAELNEHQEYKGNYEKQTKIPDGPIESLIQGELASPNVLNKKIDDNNSAIESKLRIIENDQKTSRYIVSTALGVVIAIFMKIAFDWYAFEKGITKGIELKKQEIVADSIINAKIIEKKKLIESIDSLKEVKNQFSNNKKKSK